MRVGGTAIEEAGLEIEVFGSLEKHEGGTPVGVYVGIGGGRVFSICGRGLYH